MRENRRNKTVTDDCASGGWLNHWTMIVALIKQPTRQRKQENALLHITLQFAKTFSETAT